MKRITTALLALALCILINESATSQARKLKIVTTLNYLRYIAQEVGGDKVEAQALANPQQDPHYVTPTPRMNETANGADLFIENGLSLDLWAKNVIDASGNPRIQPGSPGHLIATINVPIKELPTEVSRSWGDIHPQGNPHVWLDPLNIRIIADNIAKRLTELDRTNEIYYAQHLAKFKYDLDCSMFGEDLVKALGKKGGDILTRKTLNDELDSWLQSKGLTSKLGGWMNEARTLRNLKVVSYHKTYVYFADRFGLNIVSELEEKPGIPPAPQRRDAIVDEIMRDGVKVILNDNFYSREAADYVASKTGAKVIITYLDVAAAEDVGTYDKLISRLVESISAAAQ
jgi:ABC-type Zn uptake system ZnuABC Zn-binding protein ZnuA